MIVEVMYDMRFFLLILFVGIMAFSDSFLAVSFANPANTDGRFAKGFIEAILYTYTMILGDM